MKVAFATEDLEHVDAHFGWTPQLAVYDVTADGARQAVLAGTPPPWLRKALRKEGSAA